jgi:hypothetical protein
MQAMDERRVAAGRRVEIAPLRRELCRQARQVFFPHAPDRVHAAYAVRRLDVEEHGVRRVAGGQTVDVFRLQRFRPRINERTDLFLAR